MQKLKSILLALLCKLRGGHQYQAGFEIGHYHLDYCSCCGKERVDYDPDGRPPHAGYSNAQDINETNY
jgi:hypothetical protein